jgi:hypothetical protein
MGQISSSRLLVITLMRTKDHSQKQSVQVVERFGVEFENVMTVHLANRSRIAGGAHKLLETHERSADLSGSCRLGACDAQQSTDCRK